jgi:hypothetical protein
MRWNLPTKLLSALLSNSTSDKNRIFQKVELESLTAKRVKISGAKFGNELFHKGALREEIAEARSAVASFWRSLFSRMFNDVNNQTGKEHHYPNNHERYCCQHGFSLILKHSTSIMWNSSRWSVRVGVALLLTKIA